LKPLFVKPLTAIQPILTIGDIPERRNKLKYSSRLFFVVRKYVGDGIQKRIDLIHEI
jgi:hypothetical protein